MRDDLDVGIGGEDREGVVGEVVVGLPLFQRVLLPPYLYDAGL
jgi:hypothetical protein